MVCPASVRIGLGVVTLGGRAVVMPFIAIAVADGAREMIDPLIVIANPGARV